MSRYFEKGREPVSSYTHFWGALASVFGTLALAARSLHTGAGGAVLAGVVLFGLSLMLLIWLDYTQWAFDKFIESKREGGKVNRGIYEKVNKKGGSQSKAVQEYQQNLEEAMSVKSDLSSRPIKPITDDLKVYELPESFSRDDLRKLRESKEAIVEDTQKYAEEHMNDEKYVTYNAQFENQEEEKEEEDKKGKKDKKKPKEEKGGGEEQ